MGIQIIIPDTDNLSDQDRQVLAVVAGTTVALKADTAAPAPAKKAAAKKAAAAPAPVEEPEPDEDLVGEPTMADAVAKATELVSAGKATEVKAVLTDLGVKRVSELKGDDIATFLDSF